MFKFYFTFFIVLFVVLGDATAKVVECRIATESTTDCNPYSTRLIKAKEIKYDLNSKALIVTKTLPVPEKTMMKVVSVEDMIEKYVKVEASVRFKGLEEILSEEAKIDAAIEVIKLRNKDLVAKIPEPEEENKIEIGKEEKNILALLKIAEEKKKEELEKKSKNQGFYIVEKGDSLSMIAVKFSMKTKELRKLNRLEKKASIKIGQKLTIPYAQDKVDIIAKAQYTVKPGDNFGSIAQDFNLSTSDIIKINHLKKSSTIRIGQKIFLPFPHKLAQIKAKEKKLLAKKEAKAKKRKLTLAKKRKMKKVRGFGKKKLRVTATAYTSHRGQTDSTPFLAAWNNRLRPGMKIIAVSRDMLKRYGLRNGTKVKIGGLSGYYTVRDKMNKRFRKRIDIYMGMNRRRALRWGRRSVMLYW